MTRTEFTNPPDSVLPELPLRRVVCVCGWDLPQISDHFILLGFPHHSTHGDDIWILSLSSKAFAIPRGLSL